MPNEDLGKWKSITVEVPDVLEDVRLKINEVAEFLLLVLDIALAALELVKTFLLAYLNPIAFLLDAIIAEINALIRDLRQLGLYIAGDWNLLGEPFADLAGGFGEYERRMVARLADRTDPTRPDLSARVPVLGVFFYVSADLTEINRIVRFIRLILDFFNQEVPSGAGLPTPFIRDVKYGLEAAGFGALIGALNTDPTPPNVAKVIWGVGPGAAKNPMNPYPSPPPPGFMVTISTLPDGLALFYDRAKGAGGKVASNVTGNQVQERESGPVLDMQGRQVVLYGGADEVVGFPRDLDYNAQINTKGDPVDGSARVYGIKSAADNAPIPLTLLKEGQTYFLQRSFVVNAGALSFLTWQEDGFSIELPRDEMPHHAEFAVGAGGKIVRTDLGLATTYYVQVATVSSDLAGSAGSLIPDPEALAPVYDFQGALTTVAHTPGKPFKVGLKGDLNIVGDRSGWSDAVTVTYPHASTALFLESLQVALAVLILSRADLPLIDSLAGKDAKGVAAAKAHKLLMANVALLPTGLEDFKDLFDFVYEGFSSKVEGRSTSSGPFRYTLKNGIKKTALDMYKRMGPLPALEARLAEETADLRTLTWNEIFTENTDPTLSLMAQRIRIAGLGDMTILESLDSPTTDLGLAINPYSAGVPSDIVDTLFYVSTGGAPRRVIRGRKPHFIEVTLGGDADASFQFEFEAGPEAAAVLMAGASPGQRMFYERHIQDDGSLLVSPGEVAYMSILQDRALAQGSADMSPVFYVDAQGLIEGRQDLTRGGAMAFCRTVLGGVQSNRIYGQSRTILTLASAVLRRPPGDGAWLNIRFFDMLPAIEDFLELINKWIKAILEAFKGIVEALIAYIEFIEARIIETQQLIRKINALIQSIYLVTLPEASGLLLVSDGTDGLLRDFIGAQDKPEELGNPELIYGAGVVVVAAFAPAFLLDLFKMSDEPQSPAPPIGAFGEDNIAPVVLEGPLVEDEEPEVL